MSKVTAKKRWQANAGNCEHLTKRRHLFEQHLGSADSLLERSKQETNCLSFTSFPVKALGLQSPGTWKVRAGRAERGTFCTL